jgi:hypothetical protein
LNLNSTLKKNNPNKRFNACKLHNRFIVFPSTWGITSRATNAFSQCLCARKAGGQMLEIERLTEDTDKQGRSGSALKGCASSYENA